MTAYVYTEWITNVGVIPEFPEEGFLEMEYRDGELASVDVKKTLFKVNKLIWKLVEDENDIIKYRFVTPV